jgi:hypothetical protein
LAAILDLTVHLDTIDLLDPGPIDAFAQKFLRDNEKLHILVDWSPAISALCRYFLRSRTPSHRQSCQKRTIQVDEKSPTRTLAAVNTLFPPPRWLGGAEHSGHRITVADPAPQFDALRRRRNAPGSPLSIAGS